jgi:hypothetical protein
MKIKLLQRLRRRGRDKININSVTKTDTIVTRMSIDFDSNEYSGLFTVGDTVEDVNKKAERIYINNYLNK